VHGDGERTRRLDDRLRHLESACDGTHCQGYEERELRNGSA
jgi:hypothetical protein